MKHSNVAPDAEDTYIPPMPHLRTSRARQMNTNPVERTTEPVVPRRLHLGKPGWLVLAGVLIVLAFVVMWQQAVVPWWTGLQDQWHYGDSRITQLDANVGHGGVSHILAEYYQGSIVVVELSLTRPQEVHSYILTGMVGGMDAPVILLSVADVNHDGKPDLIVGIKDTTYQQVLYNTGTSFSQEDSNARQ